MRQILFRAKTLNEGEWVQSMTIANGTIERKRHNLYMEVGNDEWKGVDPDTLGQYTGVNDVNGKWIFEGDIVETFSIQVERQIGNYPPPNIEVEEYIVKRSVNVVEFSYGSFNIDGLPIMFVNSERDYDETYDFEERQMFEDIWKNNDYDVQEKYPYLTWDYFLRPHIIGNIHDNPELLDEKSSK